MSMLHSDVAIIGGGLMGTWAALFLRRRGRSVTLIEKGCIGEQSSGVNFGNIRLQSRHPSQFPLSLRSQEQWEDLMALIGERCEFATTGHLYIALGAEQVAKLEQSACEAAAHGVTIDVLSGKAARVRWPWLGGLVHAASFSARDATANPRLVTPAVARAAKGLGANVLEHMRATIFERLTDGFRIYTDRGATVECEILVNCAGAWGADIAARFGEPVPLFAAGPPQFVTEPIPYVVSPSVQSVDGTVIFRQVPRGNLVVAGFPRGPTDPIANRAPVPPGKTVATMNRLIEVAPHPRVRARHPRMVRHRGLPARYAAGNRRKRHDAWAAPRVRLLRSRFPARSRSASASPNSLSTMRAGSRSTPSRSHDSPA